MNCLTCVNFICIFDVTFRDTRILQVILSNKLLISFKESSDISLTNYYTWNGFLNTWCIRILHNLVKMRVKLATLKFKYMRSMSFTSSQKQLPKI